MVNTSGRGSDIPKLDNRIAVPSVMPTVSYNTVSPVSANSGRDAYSLANILQGMSQRVEDRLDLEAKAAGARAGTMAGQRGIPALMDETTIRGEAFNIAARDAVELQYDVNSRTKLQELADQYKTDPTGFKNAADAYLKGTLPAIQQFDPRAGQQFAGEYSLRAGAQLERIKDARMVIDRDAAQERAMRIQMSVMDDLSLSAQNLFSGDPATVKANLANLITTAGKLTDTAHRFGPDGRPLFSAEQRIAYEKAAQDALGSAIGQAWMGQHENPIEAWQAWNNGNAAMRIADDQGNEAEIPLKDMLGPRIYQSVQKNFMEGLRSQLSMQAQIEAAQDHAFKQGSDRLYADMSVAAQNGSLSLSMVEASRGQLEPDKYISLRALAKTGGASVSDGATVSRLAKADVDGDDIRGQLNTAYEQRQITREDYLSLYQKNSDRLQKGAPDAISAGSDYVAGSLGKLATDIGFAQAVNIPQAQAEYLQRVEDFTNEKGRRPSLSESLDIGKEVVRRYNLTATETSILSLPLPAFMTVTQKNALTASDITEIAQKTKDAFLKKNGGDPAKLQQDPDYRRESQLLKDYYDRVKLKEQQDADRANRAKR